MSRNTRQRTTGGSLTYTVVQAGGSSIPGGADTQLQFNQAGVFGGISSLTYDGTKVSYTEAPTSANHLVRKSDLDTISSGLTLGGTSDLNVRDINCRDVNATGIISDYVLASDITATDSLTAVLATSHQPNISKVGNLEDLTVVGNISCQSSPTAPTHVTRKQELDLKQNVISNTTTLDVASLNATTLTRNNQAVALQSSLSGYQPLLQSSTDIEVKDIICQNVFAENSLTINDEQVATQDFVNTSIATKQNVIGGTTDLTCRNIDCETIDALGPVNVTGNIVSSASPSVGQHLTNKTYVDNQIAGRQSTLTGSTDVSIRALSISGNFTQTGGVLTSCSLARTTVNHNQSSVTNPDTIIFRAQSTGADRFSVRNDGGTSVIGSLNVGGGLTVASTTVFNATTLVQNNPFTVSGANVTVNNGNLLITNGTNTLTLTPTQISSTSSLALSGSNVNASTVLLTSSTASTAQYPLFASATSGNLAPQTNGSFTYTPSTNTLSCTNLNSTTCQSTNVACTTVNGRTPVLLGNNHLGGIIRTYQFTIFNSVSNGTGQTLNFGETINNPRIFVTVVSSTNWLSAFVKSFSNTGCVIGVADVNGANTGNNVIVNVLVIGS